MSQFKDVLTAQHLQMILQNLTAAKNALEEHLKEDYETVKKDLESTVAHFEAEVAALKARLSATVVALVDKGLNPVHALTVATNNPEAADQILNPPAPKEAANGEASRIAQG